MNHTATDLVHQIILDKFIICIYRFSGQQFEDFFGEILRTSEPGFRQVRPYGQLGDGKNDGYIADKGIYYQVYAPDDSTRTAAYGAKKLKDSFHGIYDEWNEKYPVRELYFVINDKYASVPLPIHNAIAELHNEEQFQSIHMEILDSRSLEELFFKLPEEEQRRILGIQMDHVSESDLTMVEQQLEDSQKEVMDQLVSETSGDYIFINYSHKDQNTIYPILQTLSQNGIRFWYDKQLKPGTVNYFTSLEEAIQKSTAVLTFVSSNLAESKYAMNEILCAQQCERPLYPFYLENVLGSGLTVMLGSVQGTMYCEASDPRDCLKTFIRQLHKECPQVFEDSGTGAADSSVPEIDVPNINIQSWSDRNESSEDWLAEEEISEDDAGYSSRFYRYYDEDDDDPEDDPLLDYFSNKRRKKKLLHMRGKQKKFRQLLTRKQWKSCALLLTVILLLYFKPGPIRFVYRVVAGLYYTNDVSRSKLIDIDHINVDGTNLQLPASYKDFAELGWEAQDPASIKQVLDRNPQSDDLYGGLYFLEDGIKLYQLDQDEGTITCVPYNNTRHLLPIADCMIQGILIQQEEGRNAPQVTLDGKAAITLNQTTWKEFHKAYPRMSSVKESDEDMIECPLYDDYRKYVLLYFQKSGKEYLLTRISMMNRDIDWDYTYDSRTPDYSTMNYDQYVSTGYQMHLDRPYNDVTDGIMTNGMFLEDYLQQGWTLKEQSASRDNPEYLAARETAQITLKVDSRTTVTMKAYNFSNRALDIRNCLITEILFNRADLLTDDHFYLETASAGQTADSESFELASFALEPFALTREELKGQLSEEKIPYTEEDGMVIIRLHGNQDGRTVRLEYSNDGILQSIADIINKGNVDTVLQDSAESNQ